MFSRYVSAARLGCMRAQIDFWMPACASAGRSGRALSQQIGMPGQRASVAPLDSRVSPPLSTAFPSGFILKLLHKSQKVTSDLNNDLMVTDRQPRSGKSLASSARANG